ncbi:MAG: hypothetical protein A3A72_07225 [Deltaproteobacteria bacterium RIFCSPLOWO2_01_FULL_38_9]|nr:MAG: hypothetical protein A3A72_07225 [Deltaproteobacteria bacterium RIFCSPLOWO2_01_FULL_38_9]
MADTHQVLDPDQTQVLKDKLFLPSPESLSTLNVDRVWQGKLSGTTQQALEDLPKMTDIDVEDASALENTLKSLPLFNEAQMQELIRATASLASSFRVSESSLDTNGDGKVDRGDFIKTIKPMYQEGMSSEEINSHYYYWNYFLDIKENSFKSRMWGNPNSISPPSIGIPTEQYSKEQKAQVVILDFEGNLALEKISSDQISTYVGTLSYSMDSSFLTSFSNATYRPILNDPSRIDLVVIDKAVLIFSDNADEKTKIKILVKDAASIESSALILAPKFYMEYHHDVHDSSTSFIPTLIRHAWAGGEQEFFDQVNQLIQNAGGAPMETTLPVADTTGMSGGATSQANILNEDMERQLIRLAQAIEQELQNLKVKQEEILKAAGSCPVSSTGAATSNPSVCQLQKLYQVLDKLSVRFSIYRHQLEWKIFDLEVEEKSLKRALSEKNDPKVYEEIDRRLNELIMTHLMVFVTESVGMVISVWKIAAEKTIGIALKSAAVRKAIEKGIEMLLEQTIDHLVHINDKIFKKISIKVAVKIDKIIKFLKYLKEWVAKGKSDVYLPGFQLLLSFGPSLIKEMVKEDFEKFIHESDNEANRIALTLDSTRRLLRGYRALYSRMSDASTKTRRWVFNVGEALDQRAASILPQVTRANCETTYTNALQGLKSGFEHQKQTKEAELDVLRNTFQQARRNFERFKDQCDSKRNDLSLVRFRIERICMGYHSTDQGCDEEQARMNAILVDMKNKGCGSTDSQSMQALVQAQEAFRNKKEEIEGAIENFKEQLERNMTQAQTTRESCISVQSGCNFSFQTAMTETNMGQMVTEAKNAVPASIECVVDDCSQLEGKTEAEMRACMDAFCSTHASDLKCQMSPTPFDQCVKSITTNGVVDGRGYDTCLATHCTLKSTESNNTACKHYECLSFGGSKMLIDAIGCMAW